jgi:hypothetical protein
MSIDLTNEDQRYRFARRTADAPITPNIEHLALLKHAEWSWNDCEFGAPSMDPKRPYGNSDVEDDLAELLPHLSEADRLRVHCELPGVLRWLSEHAERLLLGPVPPSLAPQRTEQED